MLGINKNGAKHKFGIIMPAFFPASRTTYDNTQSGLSANRTQGAIDELCTTVNSKVSDEPTFTEASTRANIASGESFSTILGKIKKFFSDLKTVAFTGAYSDLSGTGNVAVKNANNNFTENQTIDKKNGTASTVANSMFSVGNNIPQGTDKNSRGIIGIFSNTAKIALLWAATDLASDINLYLPSKGGTLALTSDVPTNTNQLTNGAGFITSSGTAANVSGTVAIAHGGTGATTRLNAAKNLTNEAVSSPAYFIGMTSSWGKFGYTSVAQAKSALGVPTIQSADFSITIPANERASVCTTGIAASRVLSVVCRKNDDIYWDPVVFSVLDNQVEAAVAKGSNITTTRTYLITVKYI